MKSQKVILSQETQSRGSRDNVQTTFNLDFLENHYEIVGIEDAERQLQALLDHIASLNELKSKKELLMRECTQGDRQKVSMKILKG